MQKVLAYRYSQESDEKRREKEEVEIIDQKTEDGITYYTVQTQDGIVCTAIYNIFSNAYYADDKYGVLNKNELLDKPKKEAEM